MIKKKHNRKSAVLLTGLLALLPITTVLAGDQQEQFIKDLSQGLNARWSYEEENTEKRTPEYRRNMVEQEYDQIKEYADITFEDETFDDLAHSYLEAVELQLDSIQYMETYPGLYNTQWQAGYEIRTSIQDILVSSYGLVRTQEEGSAQAETEVQTEAESEREAESETEEPIQTEVKVFDKGQIQVWITGISDDTLYTKVNVHIENGSDQDILVTTADDQLIMNDKVTMESPLYAEVTAGKKANTTLTFDKRLLAEQIETTIEAWKTMKFTIVVSTAGSQLVLYNGSMVQVEIGEEGALSLGEVNVDQEMIRQAQTLLNKAGYECGTADGLMGNKTRSAIAEFQKANGLEEHTEVTPELLEQLQAIIE